MSETQPIKSIEEMRANRPQSAPRQQRNTTPPIGPEANLPSINVGFFDLQSFEFSQRVARALASSTMVPEQYRLLIKKKRGSDELVDNPNAIPNCIVALNMAARVGVDVLTVMQNLYVVEGRPAWSAQFVVALVNASSQFSHELQFDLTEDGTIDVPYERTWWENGSKRHETATYKVRNMRCVAWTTSAKTGARIEGAPVTMRLAVEEGWFAKPGSKWRTMPEQMIMYRAGSFFQRVHAPNLSLGLRTIDEERETIDAEENGRGEWTVTQDIEAELASETEGQRGEPEQAAPQLTHETVDLSLDASQLMPTAAGREKELAQSEAAAQDQTHLALDQGDFGTAE